MSRNAEFAAETRRLTRLALGPTGKGLTMSSLKTPDGSRDHGLVGWLFRDRSTGRITIAQWPNLPLWIFLGASAVRRFANPHGTVRTALSVIAAVGLLWWA